MLTKIKNEEKGHHNSYFSLSVTKKKERKRAENRTESRYLLHFGRQSRFSIERCPIYIFKKGLKENREKARYIYIYI